MNTPQAIELDMCLGNSDYSTSYHYYSYSPCIHNPTAGVTPKFCSDISSCNSNKLTYAVYNYTYGSVPIAGIAKDGRLILGPYKSQG
jgi:hypothetical protein